MSAPQHEPETIEALRALLEKKDQHIASLRATDSARAKEFGRLAGELHAARASGGADAAVAPPEQNVRAAKRTAPPATVFELDGALGLLVEFCTKEAPSPQPFLSLGAALTGLGAVAGRRYASPTGIRTNINAIGLGDSSSGKDHPNRRVQDALCAAGLAAYLGGEDVSSGGGILTALQQHPVKLFQIDEFGHFINCATGQKAPVHKMEIVSTITKLSTSASSLVLGKEYSDQSDKGGKPRVDLHQPHICVWGGTVPAALWNALRSHGLSDGSLARYLVFLSPENYPDPNLNVTIPGDVPPELADALRAIAAGAVGHDYGSVGKLMSSATTMAPYTVPYGDGVKAELDEQRMEQTRRLRQKEGTFATAFEGRYWENMVRCAMIRAVGRCPQEPVISLADVCWASTLVRYCIDTVLREAQDNVSDDAGEKLAKDVWRFIKSGGSAGVRRRDVIRNFGRGNPKLRDAILDDMVRGERIIQAQSDGLRGQKMMRYWAAGEE